MDFIPHLGAILLVGPFGAVLVAAFSQLATQFLVYRKSPLKALFNTSQLSIALCFSAFTFQALGGSPALSLPAFHSTAVSNIAPFTAGALVYFFVNRSAVSYVITITEDRAVRELWRRMSATLILLDVAISPFAFLVAYIYVRWGPAALLLAIPPIIGLRYSYGVNIELDQLNRDLLRVLIRTLEAQDPYTSGHSVRVAERARQICSELGLSRNETRLVETAALLHDIGKIGSAYNEILRQEGPLTATQRQLIREHPQRGVDILKSVRSLPSDVLAFVLHHHERIDGTGYPAGLSGSDIPRGARIIAVADSIDAMSLSRPYRQALKEGEIEKELLDNMGTQFDVEVVHAALKAKVITLSNVNAE